MKKCIFSLFVSIGAALSVGFGLEAAVPVTRVDGVKAPNGLQDKNIAVWGSHGRYFYEKRGEWTWQRPHLLETMEDLYTSSYVIDLLAPMLENAGAYVMMPRERDTSPFEVIIDRDDEVNTPGYNETNGIYAWGNASVPGFGWMETLGATDNPFSKGKVRVITGVTDRRDEATAQWHADIPQRGEYTLYISYASLPNSAGAVKYTVNSMRGAEEFVVDQRLGGGTWIRLGEFPFEEGVSQLPTVVVSNLLPVSQGGCVVTADAVKIGGGMGNIVPAKMPVKDDGEPNTSGMPRWTEGARYWLQWAGMPSSVYLHPDPGGSQNPHYKDDVVARPQWLNYISGGSRSNPNAVGLGIPVDAALALHSDAGILGCDSIVGTMGIYTTKGNKLLGDGRRRAVNKNLSEAIANQIAGDVKALYNPNWTLRKLRNGNYAEARIPVVPVALIEMMSHQNFADMAYGLNPEFRFDVARAIYKGIARFVIPRADANFVVQPLPVHAFAIESLGEGRYRLSWQPTADPLEPTATPASYIVERRIGDGAFIPYETTKSTRMEYQAKEGEIVSFRVVAQNSGGRSFPSEILALCHLDTYKPEILVVNGFTRLSAPYSFAADSICGFIGSKDYGVPYRRNISYVGEQVNFNPGNPWVNDYDSPGFGESLWEYDGYPVGGNTFDYPYIHGLSIAAAGYPFVSTSVEAYCERPDRWDQNVIDLILGAQRQTPVGTGRAEFTRHKAFPAELQKALARHIGRGDKLLLSGAYIAEDLTDNPYSNDSTLTADAEFARKVLNLRGSKTDSSLPGRVAVNSHWANDNTAFRVSYASTPCADSYAVAAADEVSPVKADKSYIVAEYGKAEAPAAFFSNFGDSHIALFGFPLETIRETEYRDMLFRQSLDYLSPVKRPMQRMVTSAPTRVPTPNPMRQLTTEAIELVNPPASSHHY